VPRYLVLFERSAEGFGALSPGLPGVYVTGATLEDTRALMAGAMAVYVQTLRDRGLTVPKGLDDTAVGAEIFDIP
jgi:predicted RNase H-like HicB family nuclease